MLDKLLDLVCNYVFSALCWNAEWDPWGIPDDYECEVIENNAPVPKHVPLHRPGPLPEEFYKTLEAATSSPKKEVAAGTSSESQ